LLTDDELKARAKKIKLLILDVDGVMTDGKIVLDGNGNEIKSFNVRDGHGIKMAERAGMTVAIITGRESTVVVRRAAELGIKEVHQKSHDKLATYKDLIARLGVGDDEASFVGDDIVDIPVLSRVGLSFAVFDAEDYVKEAVHMVTKRRGGEGAVREVIDYILKARGDWETMTTKYFS
jgi:3-deoxy-D-manno-octulosonate 8-phosphate phosphatase (KDO 8-P phosphatase)